MNPRLAPFVRVGALIIFIIMLTNLSTREFLKTTFIMGIPFIFALGFMKKSHRYSLRWVIGLIIVLAAVGGYIGMLTTLPQRIATHQIVIDGHVLMTDGKFDEATEKFSELERYGEIETRDDKIALVEKERAAAQKVKQAEELIGEGQMGQARELLETVPSDSRSYKDAARLLKTLRE